MLLLLHTRCTWHCTNAVEGYKETEKSNNRMKMIATKILSTENEIFILIIATDYEWSVEYICSLLINCD